MNNPQPDPALPLRCYWVLSGRFLAGEYPASRFFENQTHQILDSLITLGMDTFIDLTSVGELPPYEALLQQAAAWLDKSVFYRRFPIEDFNILSTKELETVLELIDTRLQEGHNLYIHCQAGIGRTGTVVGCYLARHTPGGGAAALEQLAELRRHLPNASIRSPESDTQWNLVKNWK